MVQECEFALIPTRIAGYARTTSSLEDAPRFSVAVPASGPAASLEGSGLPLPVVKFLTGLDEKLDMLLSHQSLALVERDYPIRLDIRRVSGSEIHFLPSDDVREGDLLEVVLMLRQVPVRLAVVKGSVERPKSPKASSFNALSFAAIRDNDQETLVSFCFEEERDQIRRRNKIGG